MAGGHGKILETLQRALNLLQLFTLDKPDWGITELASKLKLNKSVIHRILYTLYINGFVEQDAVTKKYRLGLKFFELGTVVAEGMNLRKTAHPVMEELFRQTGETIMLIVVDGLNCLCIDKIESTEGIKCTSRIGRRTPLYAGFSKVLLAYLPEDKLQQVIRNGLQQFTKNTPTNPQLLLSQLDEIRKKNYVITRGEMDEGSLGIGVPIRDFTGAVVGAVCVVGPEFRMDSKINELLELCCSAAEKISRQMGFNNRAVLGNC
ncbi:IclR family transcriptional regulator [Neomoorella mulderi]|nr:IclR family transcriptional regulator [Moorella mulderi]